MDLCSVSSGQVKGAIVILCNFAVERLPCNLHMDALQRKFRDITYTRTV
jgi:hypothetical protein